MADVVVAGAAGRMGSRVVACLREEPQLRLVAALESPGHPALGRDVGELAGAGHLGVPLSDDAKAALTSGRVLIEFSVPEASLEHLRSLAAVGGRAVIGTTGFSAEQRAEIGQLAGRAAILLSPNTSVGVKLAFKFLRIMAQSPRGALGAPGERLDLKQRARGRDPFAPGALRAARFIVDRAPGLYSMQDVLGLT